MLLMAAMLPLAVQAQQALPYTYGFEDNDLAADGWTMVDCHSSSGISNATVHSGTYAFRFRWTTTPPQYLISPELNGTENGVSVEFYYRSNSSTFAETFMVGYSTTTNDLASFTWGEEIEEPDGTWTLYSNNFPAGTKYIAIQCTSNDQYYFYLDDFTFEVPATCPKPTGLAYSNVTAHTVDLSWTAGGTETEWTIDANGTETTGITTNPYTLTGLTAGTEYTVKVKANCSADDASNWSNTVSFTTEPTCIAPSDVTVTPGSITTTSAEISWTDNNETDPANGWTIDVNGTEVVATTNPFTLDNLTASTNYTVKVKANCADDDASAWSNTISFATQCADITTLPWMVDFEGYTADAVPNCWDNSASTTSTVTSNPARVWGVYAYNGNQMMRMYNYFVSQGVALINTPTIVLPSDDVYALSFKYSHLASCGAFTVSVSNDGGANFTEVGSFAATSTSYNYTNPGTFTEVAPISLADYAGQSIIVQFNATADYGSGAIFVDDVTIDLAPACMVPSALTVSDITTNSATIGWTASGETEWTIEVNGEETTGITENPYNLTGLTSATNYTVRVKANCSATEESDWSGQISFSTACDVIAVTEENPYHEGFESSDWGCWSAEIVEGTVNWTHSSSNAVEGTQTAYLNYAATDARLTSPILDLTALTTPQLTFSHRQAVYSGRVDELYVYYRTAPEEEWVELATYTTTYATMTEEAIILPDASATYQISFYGHCVDALSIYLDDVNITEAPSCIAPSDVTVSAIAATSATISWTDNNSTAPQGWTIEVNGTEVAAATNPFTLDNLTAATTYTVKVKANCTDDDESEWSAEVTFSTACDAIIVTAANPYQEGFENGADCWSMESISGSYNWTIYSTSTYAYEGSYVALAPYQPGNVTRLITPVFDLTALENPTLTFQRLQMEYEDEDYGTITIDEMDVYYRTSATEEWVLLANYNTANTAYEMETFTLPNPSATYQISFLATGHDGNNILLDDVRIFDDVETPCATPTNVAVNDNVVTWTGDAANYNVQVTVAGEIVIDTTVSTTTFTVEGLEEGTHASVAVQAVCAEDDLSEWSEAVEFDYTNGINNYSLKANVYPNPTTGNVTVESDAINADITVFDAFGKLMMTSKVATERTELNFSEFAPGVYMVRIANDTAISTIKVVKK